MGIPPPSPGLFMGYSLVNQQKVLVFGPYPYVNIKGIIIYQILIQM
jgi:hypothetical protein